VVTLLTFVFVKRHSESFGILHTSLTHHFSRHCGLRLNH
jgi:hypothetical protein